MTIFLLFFCSLCLLTCLVALLVIYQRQWNQVSGEQTSPNLQTLIMDIQNKFTQSLEQGRVITQLQNVLQAPKLRGRCGEIWLVDMLAQMLPQTRFSTQ